MSDLPFGFRGPDDPDDPDDGRGKEPARGGSGEPQNPFAMFGGGDPQDLSAMLHRFADLMSWQGGPVNWDLAKDIARHAVAEHGDPTVSRGEREEVIEAVRLADLWLDPATALPTGVKSIEAWSRSEWIERTVPVWSQLCDPVASRAVESMGGVLPQEMQAMAGQLFGVVRQMGGMMFGGQTGQALGALAQEVVSSTDIGLPVGPEGVAALLPRNVTSFGEGLQVHADEVRLFLALREAAHHRLFAHVPWLRGRLLGAVEEYARGIAIDTSRLEEIVTHLDPSDPQALQNAVTGGLFEPEDTPQQKAALARLETLLALVEGWVDTVTSDAAHTNLPALDALAETVRRRRATGGPAERTFATLVGLELRPRRLREAAVLWRTLRDERGADGRDSVWSHPDLLPAAEDLDDPEGFARGQGAGIDISALTEGMPGERRGERLPDEGDESPRDEEDESPPGEGRS